MNFSAPVRNLLLLSSVALAMGLLIQAPWPSRLLVVLGLGAWVAAMDVSARKSPIGSGRILDRVIEGIALSLLVGWLGFIGSLLGS